MYNSKVSEKDWGELKRELYASGVLELALPGVDC